jgi:hypothetical protein
MIPVIVESPYRGNVDRNLRYLRAALRDSLMRGEAPYASHGIYPMPGVLDDNVPEERELGIEAGLTWGRFAHRSAVYVDLGIQDGMQIGIRRAHNEMRTVELRRIAEWMHGEPPLQPHEIPSSPSSLAALANVSAIELSLARHRHARLVEQWHQLDDGARLDLLQGVFR